MLNSSQPCIASPGPAEGSIEPLAFPSNQSVSVTNLAVRSHPFAWSACSIVWLEIRPSSSNAKMNRPENCSSLDSLKMGASPPSSTLRPLFVPFLEEAERCPGLADDETCPDEDNEDSEPVSPLNSVFQRTTNLSSPQSLSPPMSESSTGPARTIRSLMICSLTFPTRGTLLQATGTVHKAARYSTRPLAVGRCGCVDGKRCRVTFGETISCGKGLMRIVGRSGESVRRAVELATVRSASNQSIV